MSFACSQWDRLLADIGGMLGLFIGISACTAVEFLEFLVDAFLLFVAKCRLGAERRRAACDESPPGATSADEDVQRDEPCSECGHLQSSVE